ncbi:phage antirepressor KilAC domain-containing protein [Marisediminicola sp. LYQ134]|uniref:phage antirepressor KilAC domain-containing protein n=1 Tax=Marisediminicola sp. LYQ134 TaxID=3391061 RepID=UPI003982EFB1
MIPYRWAGHRVDVCMVILHGEPRFIARDVVLAVGQEPLEQLAIDPPHGGEHRLEVHATATTWSRDDIHLALAPPHMANQLSPLIREFLVWIDTLVRDIAVFTPNRVADLATRTQPVTIDAPAVPAAPTWYSVDDAARILAAHEGITALTRRGLFHFMSDRGWIFRQDDTWQPTKDLVLVGFLVINDVRVHKFDHLYPQICITPKGLEKLHHFLGGTSDFTLTPTAGALS